MNIKNISIIGLTLVLQSSTLVAKPTEYCALQNTYHQIVNKKNELSKNDIPKNLVVPNVKFSFYGYHEKKNMEKEAAKALENLFSAAAKEKHILAAVSGYRSYNRQSQIYSNNVKKYGEKEANRSSAKPGQSEHQTGLSMDISAGSVGYNLTQNFGNTKEGKWVNANAHNYGFIIRYPKGKEEITGYIYEPWHIRYVGKELATYLYENNLTLEEMGKCCEKEALQIAEEKKKQAELKRKEEEEKRRQAEIALELEIKRKNAEVDVEEPRKTIVI